MDREWLYDNDFFFRAFAVLVRKTRWVLRYNVVGWGDVHLLDKEAVMYCITRGIKS